MKKIIYLIGIFVLISCHNQNIFINKNNYEVKEFIGKFFVENEKEFIKVIESDSLILIPLNLQYSEVAKKEGITFNFNYNSVRIVDYKIDTIIRNKGETIYEFKNNSYIGEYLYDNKYSTLKLFSLYLNEFKDIDTIEVVYHDSIPFVDTINFKIEKIIKQEQRSIKLHKIQ